jgi:hypothetical protein
MSPLPTLYKARNVPLKRPVCAICIERTRGRTEEVRLGYRVTVWLCPGHASQAFQTKRGGRDFVRTLMGATGVSPRRVIVRLMPISTSCAPIRRANDRAATPGQNSVAGSRPGTHKERRP